ncbi:MAG TPA: hypothetical protein VK213_06050 [Bacteroidales bacterium]|nr:hypothetical protein [Bacteroidales bacterium]
MKNFSIALLVLMLVLASCNVGNTRTGKVEQDSVKKFIVTELWRTDTVLLTPESVIYDKKRDVIYVSCMNMEPRIKDGNGFISKIDRNGSIIDLRWVEGLNSPKGLTISGDTLFTADIDELVAIDINKGTIIKTIPVNGARMFNDVTSDANGNIYFSDTDDNKIHVYSGGAVKEWFSKGLNGPNGLLFHNDTMFVATQGANNFGAIDMATKTYKILTDSIIHADGIAYTGYPGYYIVSDWNGEVYIINPDRTKSSVLNTRKTQINSADLDYIQEEGLLIIPTFFKNMVMGYKLETK